MSFPWLCILVASLPYGDAAVEDARFKVSKDAGGVPPYSGVVRSFSTRTKMTCLSGCVSLGQSCVAAEYSKESGMCNYFSYFSSNINYVPGSNLYVKRVSTSL